MQIEFSDSERASLGIELELTLVDRRTGGLVSAASEILAELGAGHPDGIHPRAKHELFECTIEIITDVCATVAEARADLEATLEEVRAAADARGLAVVSVGTHPFSTWRDQVVSPSERYLELVEEMQWTARRLLIFGTHYHVGVRSAEKSIAIANRLQLFLPYFLLLSASSPYWEDADSGLASSRIKVFEALPTAGLPPQVRDWEEFEEFMGTLLEAKAIRSIREVWWDIRPHPGFGTVELRMCDAAPTLGEVAALAALAQSLVEWLDRRDDAGTLPSLPRDWIVRENKWLAARHGLDAELIVDPGPKRPARDLVAELVAELEPEAEELGCRDELRDVLRIMDQGPSYLRQRRVVENGGSGTDVVTSLVRELDSDRPGAT